MTRTLRDIAEAVQKAYPIREDRVEKLKMFQSLLHFDVLMKTITEPLDKDYWYELKDWADQYLRSLK